MKLVYSLMFVWFLSGCATIPVIPPEDKVMEIKHDVNLSKSDVYKKTLEFIAKRTPNQKESVEFKDREDGKIVFRGMTSFYKYPSDVPCMFIMTVDIKDGKYKILYERFIGYYGRNKNKMRELNGYGWIAQVRNKLIKFDQELFDFINNDNAKDW